MLSKNAAVEFVEKSHVMSGLKHFLLFTSVFIMVYVLLSQSLCLPLLSLFWYLLCVLIAAASPIVSAVAPVFTSPVILEPGRLWILSLPLPSTNFVFLDRAFPPPRLRTTHLWQPFVSCALESSSCSSRPELFTAVCRALPLRATRCIYCITWCYSR